MGVPFAEVIGDPVAHSKSPLIHRFWLERLGMKGDFRALPVAAGHLPDYLAGRCRNPFWRGCSVTAPLKEEAARAAADPTGICRRVGAANAIFRSPLGCGIGANTDLQGIAAALGGLEAKRACLIGCGGAARAVLEFFRMRRVGDVALIARDLDRGRALHRRFAAGGAVFGFAEAKAAMAGAQWIVNATPLGMSGGPAMPAALLDALAASDEAALVLDMVYAPRETELLGRAAELGREPRDGLTMLIEQAAPAFALFFGAEAPRRHDPELREALLR